MLVDYGVALGVALLALVTVCALVLGWRAARSVERFREEHHESFLGKPAASAVSTDAKDRR